MSDYEFSLCQECGRELDANREDLENTYCSKCDPDIATCEYCEAPVADDCQNCSKFEPVCSVVAQEAKACKHLAANHYQTPKGLIKFSLKQTDSEFKIVFKLGKITKTYSWIMGEKPKLAVQDETLYECEKEVDEWETSLRSMFTLSFGKSKPIKPMRSRKDPKRVPY